MDVSRTSEPNNNTGSFDHSNPFRSNLLKLVNFIVNFAIIAYTVPCQGKAFLKCFGIFERIYRKRWVNYKGPNYELF